MEQLHFEKELEKVFKQISKEKFASLATTSQNKPTVRTLSIVFINGKIYFQTSIEYTKYKQIIENNNVALCIGNIQIEGIAIIKGKTIEQKEFIEVFKINHNNAYQKYSGLETSRVIEIDPLKITIWDYGINDQNPSRIFLELETKKAYRKMEEYTR